MMILFEILLTHTYHTNSQWQAATLVPDATTASWMRRFGLGLHQLGNKWQVYKLHSNPSQKNADNAKQQQMKIEFLEYLITLLQTSQKVEKGSNEENNTSASISEAALCFWLIPNTPYFTTMTDIPSIWQQKLLEHNHLSNFKKNTPNTQHNTPEVEELVFQLPWQDDSQASTDGTDSNSKDSLTDVMVPKTLATPVDAVAQLQLLLPQILEIAKEGKQVSYQLALQPRQVNWQYIIKQREKTLFQQSINSISIKQYPNTQAHKQDAHTWVITIPKRNFAQRYDKQLILMVDNKQVPLPNPSISQQLFKYDGKSIDFCEFTSMMYVYV